jgi:hypothetical protein
VEYSSFGNEEWDAINIGELRKAMREAYEDKELREAKAKNGMSRVYNFSHIEVGTTMRDLLEDKAKATLYEQSKRVREKHKF